MDTSDDTSLIEILSEDSIFKDTMVEMNWQALQAEAAKDPIVLFPVSVVEEHGPHMDLSADIYQTNMFCRMVKNLFEIKSVDTMIAPPYYWGINRATGMFPGSFTVRPETFELIFFDIVACLVNWGFSKIIVFNVHGDSAHCSAIESSISKVKEELKIHIHSLMNLSKTHPEVDHPSFIKPRENKFTPDIHAGANETSRMHTFFPKRVDTVEALKLSPQSDFLPLGYVGDPASYHLESDVVDKFRKVSEYYVRLIEAGLDLSIMVEHDA